MVVGDIRGAAEGGTFAVVAPGVNDVFRAPTPNRFLVVDLAPGPKPESMGKPFRPIDPRIDALARLLAVETKSGSVSDPLVADAQARYARALLWACPVPRSARPPAATPSAEHIRAVVESRLAEPVTLAEIAAAAGIGPAHASRVFRRAFGMSIVAYVQEARIERAKLLLTESDRSVTEVAFAVGIASPAYVSHLFARRTALAPSGWRAERRGLDTNRRES